MLRLVRPISMRSRKPAVVSTATRAPRRSSTALVPTVVPWTSRRTSRAAMPSAVEAGQHRGRLLARPRGHLGDDHAAGLLVDGGEIGEGAADVDPHDEHGADHRPSLTGGKRTAYGTRSTRRGGEDAP